MRDPQCSRDDGRERLPQIRVVVDPDTTIVPTGRPVMIRALRTTILSSMLALLAPPAAAQVDQQRAQEFFKEAQALCERDGGRLWGVSLCGPMVIADRRTQTIATSQPAPDGPRPPVLGLVNAPVQ